MRVNRGSIGGLIRVHVSSIVNEVIRTISSQSIFYEKILCAQKYVTSKNEPTKQN